MIMIMLLDLEAWGIFTLNPKTGKEYDKEEITKE